MYKQGVTCSSENQSDCTEKITSLEKRLREQEDPKLLRFVYEAMYRISCVILGKTIYDTEPSDTKGLWRKVVVEAWRRLTGEIGSFPQYCFQLSAQRFENIHCWDINLPKVSPGHKPRVCR